jgi:hypothetical protein
MLGEINFNLWYLWLYCICISPTPYDLVLRLTSSYEVFGFIARFKDQKEKILLLFGAHIMEFHDTPKWLLEAGLYKKNRTDSFSPLEIHCGMVQINRILITEYKDFLGSNLLHDLLHRYIITQVFVGG